MTEKNSKNTIIMYYDYYNLYIKDFKVSRSVKVSEIPTFTKEKQYCYQGYEHQKIKATALIDKSRISNLLIIFDNFIFEGSEKSIVIDGIDYGRYWLTDYEVCVSEDDYIYEVALTFFKP